MRWHITLEPRTAPGIKGRAVVDRGIVSCAIGDQCSAIDCAVCFRVRIVTLGLCWRPPPLQQAGNQYRCIGSGDLTVLCSWFADWRVSGAVVCCPLSKTVLRVLCSWDCGIPVHWESLTLRHTGGKLLEYRRCEVDSL